MVGIRVQTVSKAWMAGTSPAMTNKKLQAFCPAD